MGAKLAQIVALFVVLMVLWIGAIIWYFTKSDDPAPTPAPSVSSPAVVQAPVPDQGDGEPMHADHEEDPATERTFTWTEADKSAVLELSEKTMRLFARPQTPDGQWHKEINPYLSEQAQELFAPTDPANIAVTKVTGKALYSNQVGAVVAYTQVPTDQGYFSLTLARDSQTPEWKVANIEFPDDEDYDI